MKTRTVRVLCFVGSQGEYCAAGFGGTHATHEIDSSLRIDVKDICINNGVDLEMGHWVWIEAEVPMPNTTVMTVKGEVKNS